MVPVCILAAVLGAANGDLFRRQNPTSEGDHLGVHLHVELPELELFNVKFTTQLRSAAGYFLD